jgi:hypothetical protein
MIDEHNGGESGKYHLLNPDPLLLHIGGHGMGGIENKH